MNPCLKFQLLSLQNIEKRKIVLLLISLLKQTRLNLLIEQNRSSQARLTYDPGSMQPLLYNSHRNTLNPFFKAQNQRIVLFCPLLQIRKSASSSKEKQSILS